MKTYGREQILEFLAEIDDLLDQPVAMEVIGGAAALLAYGAVSLPPAMRVRVQFG